MKYKYIVNPVFPEGGVHLSGAVLGVDPQRLILPWLAQSHANSFSARAA